MDNRWRVVGAAAIVLALPLGGSKSFRPHDSWPVGTCVRVSEAGDTIAVSCPEPHTHTARGITIEALRIDLLGTIDLPVLFGLKERHVGYEAEARGAGAAGPSRA